jgi:polyisoprenoid-binding protein YceI
VVLQAGSKASYIATETFAGQSFPVDAVGTTSDVTGQIAFHQDGAVATDKSIITVNLTTLRSDDSRRDGYIQRNTLQTSRYPEAVFAVKSVEGLAWPLPTTGAHSFTMTGDLTVHGVTKPAVWTVDIVFEPEKVHGSAKTTITFKDYGMTPPTTALVLSVEQELDLSIDVVAVVQ